MNAKSLIFLFLAVMLMLTLNATAMQMPTFLRRAKCSIHSSASVVASADQSLAKSRPISSPPAAHHGATRICFVGAVEHESNPIPLRAEEAGHVQAFLAKHRDCFLIDSNINNNSNKNSNNNSAGVVRQLPGGLLQMEKTVGFPGLNVCSTTVISVQPRSGDGLTFELVDCGLSARGAPPMVWLWNQLTRDDGKMVSATSLTDLSVHHASSSSPDEAIFRSTSQIKVQIHVPQVLVKRLGSTRMSALEEQGSRAMQQFLEREFAAAHERLHAAYMDFWREQNAADFFQQ
jgi:hypothetical protein